LFFCDFRHRFLNIKDESNAKLHRFPKIFHRFSTIFNTIKHESNAKSRLLQPQRGLARGGQKSNITRDLLQKMMIRGGVPNLSDNDLIRLPFKTSFSLLKNTLLPTLATLHGWLLGWLGWLGWLVGWVGGVGWLAGLAGWLGWLVGWVGGVGWLAGLSGCRGWRG
jgi:hypothetical protein